MSYSISGITVLGGYEEYKSISEKLKFIAEQECQNKINSFIDKILIGFLKSQSSKNPTKDFLIDCFFDIYCENNECFKAKPESNSLIKLFMQFLKNNVYKSHLYYYFLEEKDFFLIKIDNQHIINKVVKENYVFEHSFSTSTGEVCLSENHPYLSELNDDSLYDMVESDWNEFSHTNLYITKESLRTTAFNCYQYFESNISLFLTSHRIKNRLKNMDNENIFYFYKEFYVEDMAKKNKLNFDSSREFLQYRRNLMKDINFKENVFKMFKNDLKSFDDNITIEEVFNQEL